MCAIIKLFVYKLNCYIIQYVQQLLYLKKTGVKFSADFYNL